MESFPELFPSSSADTSFEKYCWARAVYDSRNWRLQTNGGLNAMGPLADLLNMCDATDVPTQIGLEADVFSVTALKEVSSGKEVCLNYGLKCKEVSMCTYGFSLPGQDDCGFAGSVAQVQTASLDLQLEEIRADLEQLERLTPARAATLTLAASDSNRDSSWLLRTFQSTLVPFDTIGVALRQEWEDVRARLLLEWARGRGIQLGPVEPATFLKGAAPGLPVRGMRASAKIGVQTKLVTVPFETMVSRYVVQASPIGHAVKGYEPTWSLSTTNKVVNLVTAGTGVGGTADQGAKVELEDPEVQAAVEAHTGTAYRTPSSPRQAAINAAALFGVSLLPRIIAKCESKQPDVEAEKNCFQREVNILLESKNVEIEINFEEAVEEYDLADFLVHSLTLSLGVMGGYRLMCRRQGQIK